MNKNEILKELFEGLIENYRTLFYKVLETEKNPDKSKLNLSQIRESEDFIDKEAILSQEELRDYIKENKKTKRKNIEKKKGIWDPNIKGPINIEDSVPLNFIKKNNIKNIEIYVNGVKRGVLIKNGFSYTKILYKFMKLFEENVEDIYNEIKKEYPQSYLKQINGTPKFFKKEDVSDFEKKKKSYNILIGEKLKCNYKLVTFNNKEYFIRAYALYELFPFIKYFLKYLKKINKNYKDYKIFITLE
jgi:hypothetical protein